MAYTLKLKALFLASIFAVTSFNANSNFLESCNGFSQENWVCIDTFDWTHTEGDNNDGVPLLVVAATQNEDGFSLHINVGENEKLGALGFNFENPDMFQQEASWDVFNHFPEELDLDDNGEPLDYTFLTDSSGVANNNFNGLDIDWAVLFAFDTDFDNIVKLTFTDPEFTLDNLSGFYFGVRAQSTGDGSKSFKGYTTGDDIFTPQCIDCGPDDPPEVPEPQTLFVFALAILGIYASRRKA
ncbi:MAG: PEP-CTERM sorting domain-containing protein [Thalassotalea sp.]|nr:PEP-CTERM sorting domain-containing protein [Thalassotalea sp.]MDG2393918.1 PEP-CTERM sorting domain-containing protein [Thalassotalea sp.]